MSNFKHKGYVTRAKYFPRCILLLVIQIVSVVPAVSSNRFLFYLTLLFDLLKLEAAAIKITLTPCWGSGYI